ncbi:uncharacterized protein LOC143848858 [Tasmannia lanceolata]|uniref:uncharacterized protein LOC143848858 n=1 Tax=Tasmannia lanceolata TaxID=3420 RepID=UPI004063FAFA
MLNPYALPFDYKHRMVDRLNKPCAVSTYLVYPPSHIPSFPSIQIRNPCFFNNYVFNFPSLPPLPPPPPCLSDFPNLNNKGVSNLEPLVEPEKQYYFKESSVPAKNRQFHGDSQPPRSRGKKGFMWKRKFHPKDDWNHVKSSIDLKDSDLEGRTTVMIKNIPNRYSREMLLDLLDKHCIEENEKAHLASDSNLSEYDFLYLPIDFKNKCNLGYAFVNFTNATAALRLYNSYHNHKWVVFDSKKICEITYARIQGKKSLVDHFRNSSFPCDSDEFLPILLTPPRNGSTSCPSPNLIGTRRVSK